MIEHIYMGDLAELGWAGLQAGLLDWPLMAELLMAERQSGRCGLPAYEAMMAPLDGWRRFWLLLGCLAG